MSTDATKMMASATMMGHALSRKPYQIHIEHTMSWRIYVWNRDPSGVFVFPYGVDLGPKEQRGSHTCGGPNNIGDVHYCWQRRYI